MSREILKNITEEFAQEKFVLFFRRITNGKFSEIKEDLDQYDDENFRNGAKLGEIKFTQTEQLAVCAFQAGQPLSERSGKKAQYEKGKRILKYLQYDAGIFIFYDSRGNFRFSLIYANYLGIRRDWSAFRRFTYFVGKDFTNKTFLQRIGDGDFSTLEKIKDAFSVEKVTRDFYQEYRGLFEKLVAELSRNHTFLNEASKNGIDTANFAKKLLGQIVFLYFVQRKGWLGVPKSKRWGEGDKNFMSNLFQGAVQANANYYNDYLEKLFYDTLNNPRRNTADPSLSRTFNCRIPFLNGGLFESDYDWKNSLIYLDNEMFKRILDVFDRYNFTVEEESPDDKEVAVDPEMLGKVFENLLEENLRKGKGTYYTPREIVYYMCCESLVQYLVSNHSNITEENIRNYISYSESFENFQRQKPESFTPGQWKEIDDLLANMKICDPACGSGAFLVGMVNMIVKLRLYLQTTPDFNKIHCKNEYELKKETIQNCIYGVDIDPGAVDIAKLRLWLALVVDHDFDDIEPLPNLDYHLMCGNSLLEEFEGVKFYNGEAEGQQGSLLVDTEKQQKIAALKEKVKEYFDIHDDEEKRAKRNEINDIRDWLVRTALEKRKQQIAVQRKNEEAKANMLDKRSREKYFAGWGDKFLAEGKIKEVLDNLHNPKKEKPFFLWKLEFIDVFEEKNGFDVVIANPPYVRMENIKEYKTFLRKRHKAFHPRADLYCYFLELALNITRSYGISTFISSNKYFRSGYGKPLRNLLRQEARIKNIVNFSGYKVFEAATVDTSIIIFQKIKPANNYLSFVEIEEVLSNSDFGEAFSANPILIPQEGLLDTGWILADDRKSKIIEKMKRTGIPLRNHGIDAVMGIKSGAKDIFEIDEARKNEFLKKESMAMELIKPIIHGQDIQKWACSPPKKYLLFIKRGTDIKRYPDIYQYLLENKKILERRATVGTHPWYELQQPQMGIYKEFEKKRIIYPDIADAPSFSLCAGGVYSDNTTYNLTTDSKFVLGILNSKLVNFFYKHIANALGNRAVRYFSQYVKQIPIPKVELESEQTINELVESILKVVQEEDFSKNLAKQVKVREYEKQIDQLVYKLYGLTPEEIEIVEGFNKDKS